MNTPIPRRTPRARRLLPVALLCLGLLAHSPPGLAQSAAKAPPNPRVLSHRLDRLDAYIKRGTRDENTLRRWSNEIDNLKGQAANCISANDQGLQKIQGDTKSLGPPVKNESRAVISKRRTLAQQQGAREKQLANCRLLLLRSDDALGRINGQLKQLLSQHLFARGPTLIAVLQAPGTVPRVWLRAAFEFLQTHSGLSLLSGKQIAVLVALLFALGALSLYTRRRLLAWATRRTWPAHFSSRFHRAFVHTFGHYLPHLILSLATAIDLYILTHTLAPPPFISVLAYGLPVTFTLIALLHLFLDPRADKDALVPWPRPVARQLVRRLKVLIGLLFVGYLLFATLLTQSLPEAALLLARGVFAAAFILNLMWAVWLFGRLPGLASTRWLRAGTYLILLATLGAEWLGYRNLSLMILTAMLGTLLLLGALALLSRLFSELFDGIDSSRHAWHIGLRGLLGLNPRDPFPGLVWLRIIVTVALWGGFALGVLQLWGLSDATLQTLQGYVVNGFKLGSLEIIPVRILLALASFALLFTLSGWFRKRLERHWIQKTHFDRGAREAMVTMSGYIGTAIALLVALGVTGVDFSHLAIIAGALSVGIGFGLQNIVNNFVSGLILLFERPIKTGDWIAVGGTEGYVKRIRIRSTQIQTFDRADVIVPNSELISSQVTNWMLNDTRGRSRIPVSVAYGTDTSKVKAILLRIAQGQPRVITDGTAPQPVVLFRAFGDSALNFELRCFIQNIDERHGVISDINFALDAAFRAEGIEIPFPQRDVHIRTVPEQDGIPPRPASAPPASRDPGDGHE